MDNKSIIKKILCSVIIIGLMASCDMNNDSSKGEVNPQNKEKKIERPVEKYVYKKFPNQGILLPHNDSVKPFYYKFDQGYLVLSVDESFSGDNLVMEKFRWGEYFGEGLELKYKVRMETDDELMRRMGEEEKYYYRDVPKNRGETDDEYYYRIGKIAFLEKANDVISSNADGTKPDDGYYEEVIEGVIIIASDGIFHFDIVKQ